MRYRWPNGAQCAVVLSFDVDAESGYVYRNPKEAASQLDQMEERRFGDAFPSAPELLGREVDRGEPEALGQQPRLIRAAAAAELDHAAASRKSRDELVAPVGPRIVGDLCLPRLPGVDHRVVAGRDESRARVRHATSTSSRPAACSARCSASMEVGAVAIT